MFNLGFGNNNNNNKYVYIQKVVNIYGANLFTIKCKLKLHKNTK